jgi:hypothetical protein
MLNVRKRRKVAIKRQGVQTWRVTAFRRFDAALEETLRTMFDVDDKISPIARAVNRLNLGV